MALRRRDNQKKFEILTAQYSRTVSTYFFQIAFLCGANDVLGMRKKSIHLALWSPI
jgi:hypothetical protein